VLRSVSGGCWGRAAAGMGLPQGLPARLPLRRLPRPDEPDTHVSGRSKAFEPDRAQEATRSSLCATIPDNDEPVERPRRMGAQLADSCPHYGLFPRRRRGRPAQPPSLPGPSPDGATRERPPKPGGRAAGVPPARHPRRRRLPAARRPACPQYPFGLKRRGERGPHRDVSRRHPQATGPSYEANPRNKPDYAPAALFRRPGTPHGGSWAAVRVERSGSHASAAGMAWPSRAS
jgi:hypothetical protein